MSANGAKILSGALAVVAIALFYLILWSQRYPVLWGLEP